MDEDERLLASEEGKKLSSKERRQLRNKVSARAFRSRRKEYIGQLEGEVANKVQEANDLRVENQQLREENNRLTDLTRMLLSSQAFSGFLQELSQSGLPASHLQAATQQKPVKSQPQPAQKDVASHEAAHQMHMQQPQIGMALIPETHVDLSILPPSNGWMSGLSSNGFQVYAITELPEPPALDLEALSGKSKSSDSTPRTSKDMPQSIPRLPESQEHVEGARNVQEPAKTDESVLLDVEAFALYFDSCGQCSDDFPQPLEPSPNAEARSDEESLARLKKLCSDLDAACDRLTDFTIHMD